ncbi:protein enabled homolog isoform X2 [Pangasianodon hypophthalmus]|nr:protein enabled homolog isoform X2 [Pangasianodon hypophthalmus]
MEGRMSHFSRASKDKCDGKERNERLAQRQKRKGAKNISTARSSSEAGERLPLIGSVEIRATEKSAITSLAGKRKRAQPPISTALQNSFMGPWEGSSNSESSFTSIPPPPPLPSPPSPRPPPPLTSSEIFPNPPQAIRDTNPGSQQSFLVKRRLLHLRGPPRPPRLPPLRQVTNLSFSRSFTFSFFELPWHQSVQNRADRLKELVVLLRKIQY